MHTLCSWIEGLTQMMTRKTKVIIKHNERYLRLRREGRNQLMVSQERMPFMFLVMLHTLPEMKDLKQRKTEVTIHHAAKNKEWIWWAEKGGINKLCIVSQHVKSICQDDQLLRLQLRNDSSPCFQWFNSSFSIWWLANHQWLWTKEIGKCCLSAIFGSIHNC